jgi:hypothetical protein
MLGTGGLTMAEYIDREALLKRLKFKRDTDPNMDGRKRYGLDSAISQVRKAPTADVVEVVRCEECKNYNTASCPSGLGWCEEMQYGTHDKGFCSYGERKCNDGRTEN